MINHTKVLLGIEDPNIIIDNNLAIQSNSDSTIFIYGTLNYRPKACQKCGVINTNQIINYGWRTVSVRLPRSFERTIILKLRKQNFHCKTCHGYFLAQTTLTTKHCSISLNCRKACIEKLKETSSMTHIAKELATSTNYVSRVLALTKHDFKVNLNYLPEVLLFDEIKTTKDALSFEYMDAKTHELIDLIEARTIYQITKHFNRYVKTARDNVKIIVTDMNYTYPKLAETLFPNAIVVYDRFHIVQSMTRAFNQTRIQVMKKLTVSSQSYKQLKRYWKLLLKPMGQLNYKNFRHWSYFKEWQTETDLIQNLLAIDPILANTYDCLQNSLTAIRNKDWSKLNYQLTNAKGVSEQFQKVTVSLMKQPDYLKNALRYPYSNGPLEGLNNKLKVIKRNAYGFKNFSQYRLRILSTIKF
ncbi:ISL3 family transposase [Dellaglioa sp. L3N]